MTDYNNAISSLRDLTIQISQLDSQISSKTRLLETLIHDLHDPPSVEELQKRLNAAQRELAELQDKAVLLGEAHQAVIDV
jgi:hypothetical protein